MLNHIDLCEYPEANRIGREDTFSELLYKVKGLFGGRCGVPGRTQIEISKKFSRVVLKWHDYGILKYVQLQSSLHLVHNEEISSWHFKFQ